MPYLVFWILTTLYGASFWAPLVYLDILQQVTDLLPTSVTCLLELAELELDSDFSISAGFIFYKAIQSANKASGASRQSRWLLMMDHKTRK